MTDLKAGYPRNFEVTLRTSPAPAVEPIRAIAMRAQKTVTRGRARHIGGLPLDCWAGLIAQRRCCGEQFGWVPMPAGRWIVYGTAQESVSCGADGRPWPHNLQPLDNKAACELALQLWELREAGSLDSFQELLGAEETELCRILLSKSPPR